MLGRVGSGRCSYSMPCRGKKAGGPAGSRREIVGRLQGDATEDRKILYLLYIYCISIVYLLFIVYLLYIYCMCIYTYMYTHYTYIYIYIISYNIHIIIHTMKDVIYIYMYTWNPNDPHVGGFCTQPEE